MGIVRPVVAEPGKRIAVFGAGYVGLVTGACFAEIGHDVVIRDVDTSKIAALLAGDVPIFEPGLDEVLEQNRERLRFTTDVAEAVEAAEFVYVAVGTPPTYSGDADLSAVWTVVDELPQLDHRIVVVMKSTVPVGTGDKVRHRLDARGLGEVGYASNPEFTAEGTAIRDFMHPDRIVVGSFDDGDGDAVAALHSGIDAPIVRCDVASAEMIKLAANAALMTRISFINEIANVCEATGADVVSVAEGVGLDRRIGSSFLRAGIGYGGSCLVGDETVLVRRGRRTRLVSLARLYDETEPRDAVEILTWRPDGDGPEFLPVELLTRRHYNGDVVEVRTKMGRRVVCTPDHPFVTQRGRVLAEDLTFEHRLPIAQGVPASEAYATTPHLSAGGLALVVGREAPRRHRGVGPKLERASEGDVHRLPDLIWDEPLEHKRALLSGLWLGDGSWSFVAQGPSVVIEYGTVSRELADGMLRLLGELGIVGRLKVGRTAKSTVDTYWLVVSGADQVERLLEFVPEQHRRRIVDAIGRQAKRIAPTGYRRGDNAAWVRVVDVARRPYSGFVYSLEVPPTHTFVTTGGLVCSNCFPKDSLALKQLAANSGYHFQLLNAVIEVNELQKRRVLAKLERHLGTLRGKTVALLGLAFKPNTDDMREAPSLVLAGRLLSEGASVRAWDPVARPHDLRGVVQVDSVKEALAGADAAVIVTEWPQLGELDWAKIAATMTTPVLIDGRNMLDPAAMLAAGFRYEAIGRAAPGNAGG
ncbi:MAG: nucleotide sugar dehydrogenase [Actinobacteria bacterium]|nr:MAG: nucleotide sugar dehydrogenase [Actinomycetota bacterium]